MTTASTSNAQNELDDDDDLEHSTGTGAQSFAPGHCGWKDATRRAWCPGRTPAIGGRPPREGLTGWPAGRRGWGRWGTFVVSGPPPILRQVSVRQTGSPNRVDFRPGKRRLRSRDPRRAHRRRRPGWQHLRAFPGAGARAWRSSIARSFRGSSCAAGGSRRRSGRVGAGPAREYPGGLVEEGRSRQQRGEQRTVRCHGWFIRRFELDDFCCGSGADLHRRWWFTTSRATAMGLHSALCLRARQLVGCGGTNCSGLPGRAPAPERPGRRPEQ